LFSFTHSIIQPTFQGKLLLGCCIYMTDIFSSYALKNWQAFFLAWKELWTLNYRVLTPDYTPSFCGCKEVDLELSNPIQQP
jgi:hypothetical protein